MIKPAAFWDCLPGRRIQYVVLPGGPFSADPVFCVALLHLFHRKVAAVRTGARDLVAAAIRNPDIWVVGHGGNFDPGMRNFDAVNENVHGAPATSRLLFSHLFPGYRREPYLRRVYEKLLGFPHAGAKNPAIYHSGEHEHCISRLIRAFNREDPRIQDMQFLKAVDFGGKILANELNGVVEPDAGDKRQLTTPNERNI